MAIITRSDKLDTSDQGEQTKMVSGRYVLVALFTKKTATL